MMKKKYDVVVKSGTYTDTFGSEKNRWIKIGSVMESERGLSMKIDSIPLNWDGWSTLMDGKIKTESPRSSSIDPDEIPF